MEVMDLDDDEDEQRDAGEGAFSKDSRLEDGGRSSLILIAKSRPIMLKPSDSQTSRIELQISDGTRNKGEPSVSKSSAKSSLLSTPEKRILDQTLLLVLHHHHRTEIIANHYPKHQPRQKKSITHVQLHQLLPRNPYLPNHLFLTLFF